MQCVCPKHHSATYSENLKSKILDIQAENFNNSIVIVKDFNMTLENKDSANRNANTHEINARRIIKYIMLDTKKNCYREIKPTGGFTWQ
jgi:hypothetical protein